MTSIFSSESAVNCKLRRKVTENQKPLLDWDTFINSESSCCRSGVNKSGHEMVRTWGTPVPEITLRFAIESKISPLTFWHLYRTRTLVSAWFVGVAHHWAARILGLGLLMVGVSFGFCLFSLVFIRVLTRNYYGLFVQGILLLYCFTV
jgi:hypothetical protein